MGGVLQTKRPLRVLGGVIAAWVVPSLVLAAPATRATVRVEIDVTAIEKFDAGGIERDVRARTEAIVDEQGYFLDDAAEDSIVVKIDYVDKEDLEYGIHIFVYDDGAEVRPGEEWLVCKYCSHALVGERYAERLPGALGRLSGANEAKAKAAAEAAATAREAEAPGDGAVGVEPQPGSETSGGEAEPKPERPFLLRNVGIGLLVPGGVALGVGLGLVVAGTREVDRGNEAEIADRNYRAPGTAVAIVGGIAAATGIALLVAHAIRKRDRGTTERVTWTPVLEGTAVGAALRGRF